ncbi:single strand DNA binding protein [Paraconexibacter sp. AEG42_29]|uniref:Single-stranded DNA-binding protein n=1 Tax=Paraconexibacter sp. AEG42_29 TaxID=2997339 RepID=A0AAU7B343_9ACTN
MAGFTINHVVVSGNLTRDPETRALPSGMQVCNFSVAVNERIKDRESGEWTDRPNYFDVTVWGGMGEWLGNNIRKGQAVVVSGRLNWRSWEKDGVKRSAVSIVADSVVPERSGGGGGGGGSYGGGGGGGFQPRSDVPADMGDFAPAPAPVGGGGAPTADDDIPF